MPAAPVRVPPAVARGACGAGAGASGGGAGCLRRRCGFGGGARSASGPVGGSGACRGVSVLGTARNRSATEVDSVDAPTAAGGHPPPRPLLAVRACGPPHAAAPSPPYAALRPLAAGQSATPSPPSLHAVATPPQLHAVATPPQLWAPATPPQLRAPATPPQLRAVVPLGRHGWAQRHPASAGPRPPPRARTRAGHPATPGRVTHPAPTPAPGDRATPGRWAHAGCHADAGARDPARSRPA